LWVIDSRITLDNIQVRSILDRQEDALRRLRFRESVNPNLLEFLTDPSVLASDKVIHTRFWDQELDAVQKEAINEALSARDVFLVHGPPGTGKTRMIVELVRQILNSDGPRQKVLLTSQSNVAVNHALLSLLNQQPGLRECTVRVGREEKAGETSELLLDQQLARWAEQVKAKSNSYVEDRRRQLAINPQLTECLGVLDECERAEIDLASVQREIGQRQREYEEASQDFLVLRKLMAEAETLRENASSLLRTVADADVELRQLMQTFDSSYLSWASEFLAQAEHAAMLSARRAELKEQIDALTQAATNLKANLEAGVGLVRETLRQLYQKDILDLRSQRTLVNEKLAAQQDVALRLGRIQKISQDWCQRISRGTSDFAGAYLTRCDVVGATCIGVAAKGDISDAEFDWVIVDEAGRSTHPELAVPMVRGRKIVLVGDHQQLPPIVDRDLSGELLEEIQVSREELQTSLFQELIGPTKAKTQLQVQYRMCRAIGNLVSVCFYEGSLEHGDNVGGIHHGLAWAPTPVIWCATNRLKNHADHRVGHSYENLSEAEVIQNLLGEC